MVTQRESRMDKVKARFCALCLVLSMLLASACGVSGTPAAAKEPLDLTILHTGQVYGEISPCG
jgi:hypothetical protein